MTATKRAAIYARVSTTEGRQDPETQVRELREYAGHRGFELVGEYIDHATGRTEDRNHYQQLLADVRRRKVDVVDCPLLGLLRQRGPRQASQGSAGWRRPPGTAAR